VNLQTGERLQGATDPELGSFWDNKIEARIDRRDFFQRSSVHGKGWLVVMFALGSLVINPCIAIVYSDPNRKETIPTPDMIESPGGIMVFCATAVLLMIGGTIWLEEEMINLCVREKITSQLKHSFRKMYLLQKGLAAAAAVGFCLVFGFVFHHGVTSQQEKTQTVAPAQGREPK
jgi:hypothetical protein